ncbi:MAG: bifunctional folylpolyglutamate synthase/dihydrofolate synthase [Actinomycetota bacterium]
MQVAGTNGKTTTARMTGAILAAHGLTTGVYTSPHLQSIRERFSIGGDDEGQVRIDLIAPDELAALVQYLLPYVELVQGSLGENVTYFELTTAMAFEWFANRSVAAGVYEAGLGGAWDATNIVAGDVSVLTRIAVDHIAFLGSTPLENAREKVGIVKPGARCVSAVQEPEVAQLVQETADRQGALLAVEGKDFRLIRDDVGFGGRIIAVDGPQGGHYEDLFVPLFGAHMARNATLAIAAAEELLGRALDYEALTAGLGAVTSPGRLEVVSRDPLVVLDGAHNPQAARALGPALVESFGKAPKTFVISIFADKDIDAILTALQPFAARVLFWQASSPRASSAEALREAAERVGFDPETLSTPASLGEAVDSAQAAAGKGGVVVVTGSIHGVGEARDLLVGPVE